MVKASALSSRTSSKELENFTPIENALSRLFEKMDQELLLPEKYFASLEYLLFQDLKTRYLQNPDTPLKEVLAITIQQLDARVPEDQLIGIVKFCVNTWQKFRLEEAGAKVPVIKKKNTAHQ